MKWKKTNGEEGAPARRKKTTGEEGVFMKWRRRLCDAIWLCCWILFGISLYYHHEGESWALLQWDVRSLFTGSPDFLAHGKKLILCWLIGAVLLLLFFRLLRRQRTGKRELVFALFCLTAGIAWAALDGYEGSKNNGWQDDVLIAHALGSVDGKKGTQSLEAFEQNYAAGQRVFEADLAFTEDQQLVLTHDWTKARKLQTGLPSDRKPTEEEFLNAKIYDQYTPLNFRNLCELMLEYPDIYVVTDSKYTTVDKIKQEFQYMITVIRELDAEELLDRFVIQVYNQEMYEQVHSQYPFQNYLLTLYKLWEGDSGEFLNLCRWCASNHIDTITMKTGLVSKKILRIADRYGISVYVHTVNDVEKASSLLEMGVDGIYTDSLLHEDLA